MFCRPNGVTFPGMDNKERFSDFGCVHLFLVGNASESEPKVLRRTFHLGVDENSEMCVVATTVDELETIEGPVIGRIHVHPAAWSLVLQDYRRRTARFEIWIETVDPNSTRLKFDAFDDPGSAREVALSAVGRLQEASEVPLYLIIHDKETGEETIL